MTRSSCNAGWFPPAEETKSNPGGIRRCAAGERPPGGERRAESGTHQPTCSRLSPGAHQEDPQSGRIHNQVHSSVPPAQFKRAPLFFTSVTSLTHYAKVRFVKMKLLLKSMSEYHNSKMRLKNTKSKKYFIFLLAAFCPSPRLFSSAISLSYLLFLPFSWLPLPLSFCPVLLSVLLSPQLSLLPSSACSLLLCPLSLCSVPSFFLSSPFLLTSLPCCPPKQIKQEH